VVENNGGSLGQNVAIFLCALRLLCNERGGERGSWVLDAATAGASASQRVSDRGCGSQAPGTPAS